MMYLVSRFNPALVAEELSLWCLQKVSSILIYYRKCLNKVILTQTLDLTSVVSASHL